MTRRTTALAAALSLLPLGQPLLLGSTTALATAAVVLSTQAAHAQSQMIMLTAVIANTVQEIMKEQLLITTRQ